MTAGSRVPACSWIVIAALVIVSLGSRHLRRRAAADHRGAGRGDRPHAEVPDLRQPVGGRLRRGGVAGDPARDRAARGGGRERPTRSAPPIAATYGDQVQLIPPASGFAGLVWILPVVAVVVALVALSAAFARWRRTPDVAATDEDRALVEQALRER